MEWIFPMQDVDNLDVSQLQALKRQILERIGQLDAREPKNPASPEYEQWGDAHEELEDLLDDVLDRLEELA